MKEVGNFWRDQKISISWRDHVRYLIENKQTSTTLVIHPDGSLDFPNVRRLHHPSTPRNPDASWQPGKALSSGVFLPKSVRPNANFARIRDKTPRMGSQHREPNLLHGFISSCPDQGPASKPVPRDVEGSLPHD